MANKWLQHVKQVKAQNQGMKFKDVLKLAAKNYKKQAGGNDTGVPAQPQGSSDPAVKHQQGGVADVQSTEAVQKQQGGAQDGQAHAGQDNPHPQSGGKKSRKNRRNKKGGNKSRKNRNNKKSRRNKKGGNKSRKNRNNKKSRKNRKQRKH